MLDDIARLTNAVDEMGYPLVVQAEGKYIPDVIVEFVSIAVSLPIDIDAGPAATCNVLEGLNVASSGTALGVLSPGETACSDLDMTNINEILSGVCDIAFSTDGGLVLGTIPLNFNCAGPPPSERLTCEMVNPCKYALKEDQGNGGFVVNKTYFPICVQDGNKFRQKCYPKSIIAGLGAGDTDPFHNDRTIVDCGCCPSIDEVPEGIQRVRGSTQICEGALDCVAASTLSKISLFKKIKFQMCINGEEAYKKNFYLPHGNGEVAYCGSCK